MPRIIELYDAPPHSAAQDAAPLGWAPHSRFFLQRGKGAYVKTDEVLKDSIKTLRKGFVRINGVDIRQDWYYAWKNLEAQLVHEVREGDILVVRGTICLTMVMTNPTLTRFNPEVDESRWSVWTYRGSRLWSENPAFARVAVMPILPPTIRPEQWNATEVDFATVTQYCETPEIWDPPKWMFIHPATGYITAVAYTTRLKDILLDLELGSMVIACDIETRAGAISCVGIAWGHNTAMCIPLMSEENFLHGNPHYWTEAEEMEILTLLRAVLEHPNARIIGHNFNYDTIHLWSLLRILPRFWADTMHLIAAYDPKRPKSLAAISSYLSPYYRYWKAGNLSFFEGGHEKELWHYNCLDCWYTIECFKVLEPVLEESPPESQARYLQRMFYPFTAMTLRGLMVDLARWRELQEKVAARLKVLEDFLHEACGPFSVTSPKDVSDMLALMDHAAGVDASSRRGELLALVLAEPETRTLEEEAAGLVREAFEITVPRSSQVAQLVRKQSYNENALHGMKGYSQFHSVFLDKVIEAKQLHSAQSKAFSMRLQDWNGGRPHEPTYPCLRSSFSLTGTITHRLSSSKTLDGYGGNLQTLPREPYPHVGHIRSAVRARPGYKIVSCDLSRGDMQVLARTSTTGDLKKKLEDGYDLYLATGLLHTFGSLPAYEDLVEGSPTYKATRARLGDSARHKYKTSVLAIGYGSKGKRIGVVFDKDARFGDAVIEAYYTVAPEVGAYQQSVSRLVREGFPVVNHYGMECTFPTKDITNALAWGPQSVVARYVNECWMFATVRWPKWKVLLQVHDEILFEVPDEECVGWDAEAVSREFQEAVIVPQSHLYPAFSLPFHASEPMERWAPLET